MENLTKLAWFSLILIHLMPAMVLFMPTLAEKLYGVSPSADVGVLIIHRGSLFLAIIAACLFAIFDARTRRAMTVVVGISVIGFLWVYVRGGSPESLGRIFKADLAALIPLAFVMWRAWS